MSRAAKGADCKSAGFAFVGSSPTSPTSLRSRSEQRLPRHSPKGDGGLVAASFGSASQPPAVSSTITMRV